MKNNISKLKDCYGCGVCTICCPVNIISLELNLEGFYVPVIKNQEKCIECGVCLDICAFNHNEISLKNGLVPKAYGAWSKNDTIREDCTTGGIGYELAKLGLKKGEAVCGVRYDYSLNRAEHIAVSNEEGLEELKGTKYIPSFSEEGFKSLKRKESNMVFGLPCQIDSFRRYIRRFKIEDHYALVDLFCYGVPSLALWRRYLKTLEKQISIPEKIKFRSKRYGWHDSACVEVKGEGKELWQKGMESDFFKLFFSDSCLNKCCYKSCKYKRCSSSADIRIGDFWGKEYKEDNKGVNLVLTFTKRGEEILRELGESCEVRPANTEEAVIGQPAGNARYNPSRSMVLWGVNHNLSLGLLASMARVARKVIEIIK